MCKLCIFCSLYKLLFTSWLFVLVSRADKTFEVVQNWCQTLKQRKTWWNRKPLGYLHSKWNFFLTDEIFFFEAKYDCCEEFWVWYSSSPERNYNSSDKTFSLQQGDEFLFRRWNFLLIRLCKLWKKFLFLPEGNCFSKKTDNFHLKRWNLLSRRSMLL